MVYVELNRALIPHLAVEKHEISYSIFNVTQCLYQKYSHELL